MKKIHRLWLLAFAFALAFAVPPPVSVDVAPKRALGRRDIRVTARVVPNKANRRLVIAIDGPEFQRQDIDLNAHPDIEDPRTFDRWFKAVPPGRYDVVAAISRADGSSARATAEFCLVGADENCLEDR